MTLVKRKGQFIKGGLQMEDIENCHKNFDFGISCWQQLYYITVNSLIT